MFNQLTQISDRVAEPSGGRVLSPLIPEQGGEGVAPGSRREALSDTLRCGQKENDIAEAAQPRKENTDELAEAREAANICERFLELTQQQHLSVTAAARLLGRAPSYFSGRDSMLARYLREGVAGLAPARRNAGAPPSTLTERIEALVWFVPAAKFFYIHSNRTEDRGSVPEAIRRTISLPRLPIGWTQSMRKRFLAVIQLEDVPACPADLAELILARQNQGVDLVPARIARLISAPAAVVRWSRSPRDASLDYLSAPGSQRRYFNAQSGARQIMLPGDWFGGDDATPGIAVCVPCDAVITPCSQRYGVLLGRFQWLAYHEARTDKVLAWDYVVRPRGSYRAEDVVNGIGAVTRAHGIPRKGWQLEGGTFNSRLVQQCIKLLGCEHWRTYSPHQKAIESIFNRVWTRLAVQFPHADMGRYRAENEANCALYEACKAGHKDPRQYFPTIEVVIAAFQEEVQAHNTRRIFSEQYGAWVPDEYFTQAVEANPLRPFAPGMEWIFHPYSAERKIRGMMVKVSVPMFENFSVPFHFGADWMPLYDKHSVRVHFNPREPKCTAKVIWLDGPPCGKRAGDVLGDALLIGETASHIRYLMGWATDNQQTGYLTRQRAAHFMRRETRAIGAGGRHTYAATERRDGLGAVTRAEAYDAAPATDRTDRADRTDTDAHGPARTNTPDNFSNSSDGVPNAGDASNEPQAGTGEPPARSKAALIPGSATEVNAPLSQSSSSAGVGDSTRQEKLAELREFERRNQELFG